MWKISGTDSDDMSHNYFNVFEDYFNTTFLIHTAEK